MLKQIKLYLFTGLAMLFLSQENIFAQVNYRIISRYAGTYRVQSSDVWNLDIQFNSQQAVRVYLQATITDNKGRKLVRLTSEPFDLQIGSNSLNAGVTVTALKEYFADGIEEFEVVNGSLPAGQYNICYVMACERSDCNGLGQDALFSELDNCFQISVEPPTPLLLSWPEDEAEITTPRPGFIWIPPMPLAQLSGFGYTYTLYKAAENQTCQDAAQRNIPLYQESGIELPALSFPVELDDLDTGTVYCWKVDGVLAEIPVAQSEVWQFKLKVPEKELRGKTSILPQLTASSEPYVVSTSDTLILVFNEQYNAREGQWTLSFQPEGPEEKIQTTGEVITPRFNGEGNIFLLPYQMPSLTKETIYLLRLLNAKNDIFQARIIFK